MSKVTAVLRALFVTMLAGGAVAGIAGCAAAVTSQPGNSVTTCADYGFWAIEHRVTVSRTPQPCQGLSGQEVNQAIVLAISRAVDGQRPGGRAARRLREDRVGRYLADLITTPRPASPATASPVVPSWQPSASRQGPAATGRNLAMDIGALAAWLITAGSGAYVLARWIARSGALRRPGAATGDAGSPARLTGQAERTVATASTSVPPPAVVGHVGLGLTGLAFWILYVITGWAGLAWTAVILLVPVAGLGMAVVTLGLPGPGARRGRASPQGGGPSARTSRPWLAAVVIAGHGVLAASTMLVVLLAALGPAAT
jgi:manganese efflux pump family protein